MESMILFVLVFRVLIPVVSGSCPELTIIEGGSGEFQSPNFAMNEYGVKANCSWRLSSKQLTNYALKLDFVFLKIYYVISSRKACILGSYNVTINEDQLDCQIFAREGSADRCHSYYNSHACSGLSETASCTLNEMAQFPVEVKYQSDGRTIDGEELSIDGFRIRYSFIQCPELSTTATTNAANSVGTPTNPESGSAPSATPRFAHTPRNKMTDVTPTMAVADCDPRSDAIGAAIDPAVIAGTFIGGAASVVFLGIIAYGMKKYFTTAPKNIKVKNQNGTADDGTYQETGYEDVTNTQFPNSQSPTLQENPGYEAVHISSESTYETPLQG